MSISLSVYALKMQEVNSVFGGGDKFLVDRIREKSPARYRIRNRSYTELDVGDKGQPTVDEAILDLVFRNISRPDYSWWYCFALELICETIGTELEAGEFSGLHECLDEVFDRARIYCLAGRLMAMPRYPIPIPFNPEKDPLISCLTLEEAVISLNSLTNQDNESGQEGKAGEEKKMYAQFTSWLKYAVHTQNDLVIFYY